MIALAALNGPLPKAGVVVVALLTAVALVLPGGKPRAAAMLAALVLAPVLLVAEIWHSSQLRFVHHHPLEAAVAAIVALAAVALLAWVIARRPWLLAALVVLTLPFRIPISVGGTTSNLLVPLYVVVGAGTLAYVATTLRGRPGADADPHDGVVAPEPAPGWIERLLALYVVLYAIQSLYSPEFEKALQQVVFFYVPFALMFCLLRRLRWSTALLRRCLVLVVSLALIFALIGFVEYATKTLLLNQKAIAENSVHTYFAVNSVFYDPNIFGRFLALVMILLAAVLIYTAQQREQLLAVGALAVLWAALVFTLSRSSLGALLVGLAILGALRWKARPILLGGVAVIVIGIAALAISPTTFGVEQGANGLSGGRGSLVGGGLHLFAQRPVWGYGSGSFQDEYLCRIQHLIRCGTQYDASLTLSASHTIPITIAAEQGLIGLLPYVALVIVAAVVLLSGARRDPPRAAVAAAFIALVFHTLLYADFLEDPFTWALLGIGVALGYAPLPRLRPQPARSEALATA